MAHTHALHTHTHTHTLQVVMSSELDAMYGAFLINRVPELWAKVAYPSLKPLSSWVVDMIERVRFMAQWLTAGPPVCFWLSGFFFPQAIPSRSSRRPALWPMSSVAPTHPHRRSAAWWAHAFARSRRSVGLNGRRAARLCCTEVNCGAQDERTVWLRLATVR